MFDRVIAQNELTQQLIKDYQQSQLAPAMLIFGNSFTGKLTIAMELARMITCLDQGASDCPCNSCYMQKKRLHTNTFMLGGRYFKEELQAVLTTVKSFLYHNKTVPANVLLLLLQTIRNLMRRFDSVLWEHDDPRYKEAKNLVPPIHEWGLEFLEDQRNFSIDNIDLIEEKIYELAKVLDAYSVNVGQIRSLIQHSQALSGQKRVVIIEQAHLMQDSARNSLLKVLEEPQEGLYFILITTQKATIMPTILSRVRPYHTRTRSIEEQMLVLERVFRNNQVTSLTSLLSPIDPEIMVEYAKRFLAAANNEQLLASTFHPKDLIVLQANLIQFFQTLQQCIPHHDNFSLLFKKNLLSLIGQYYQGFHEYNQNSEVLLYALYSQVVIDYKNYEKAK